TLEYMEELIQLKVPQTIDKIYNKYGDTCGIVGIGPSGENMLPVSTLFTTYTKGNPSFYCVRYSIGDVFGFKNIKAVVVKNKHYFKSYVNNYEEFKAISKKLSKLIIHHPICGKALPNLGSQTLLKLMQGESIDFDDTVEKENSSFNDSINRTCSPLCVVGCLNRHAESKNDIYSAPLESEVMEGLENAFGINDNDYARKFTGKCFDLGIDCMEFLFSCEMYF